MSHCIFLVKNNSSCSWLSASAGKRRVLITCVGSGILWDGQGFLMLSDLKTWLFRRVLWARSGLQHFAKHLGLKQGDSYRVFLRNKSCQTNLISFPDRVVALEVRKKQKMPTKALRKAFSTVSPAVLRKKRKQESLAWALHLLCSRSGAGSPMSWEQSCILF